VTGSNGKTTVTQMLASILAAQGNGERSLATRGNFNNEIGLPLTLLRLRPEHQRGVVELGMNHPGEIARLAAIARPTIALVNNAQREHQEFMQSVEAVARENAHVFESLPPNGTAVFPAGDAFTNLWSELAACGGARRCLRFGDCPSADVRLGAAEWLGEAWTLAVDTPLGRLKCRLQIAGKHNLGNAMAAIACALAAGVSLAQIEQGLEAFRPVSGRSNARVLPRADGAPLTLVDDSYNANPDSVRAAIDVLSALPGPHLLVLGDMGEVGNQGPQFHAEVGAWAATRGIESVYAMGDECAHAIAAYSQASQPSQPSAQGAPEAKASSPAHAGDGRHFDNNDIDALNAAVLARVPQVASVLVKGSRFMKMERVVQAIDAHLGNQKEEAGHAH
jgi:UDP-N-acetylmuramoyl-tripeptide--D-alanyl-D-alanine ligase